MQHIRNFIRDQSSKSEIYADISINVSNICFMPVCASAIVKPSTCKYAVT